MDDLNRTTKFNPIVKRPDGSAWLKYNPDPGPARTHLNTVRNKLMKLQDKHNAAVEKYQTAHHEMSKELEMCTAH